MQLIETFSFGLSFNDKQPGPGAFKAVCNSQTKTEGREFLGKGQSGGGPTRV